MEEMLKEIVVGELKLAVHDCYAYIYDYGKGKEVLRLDILAINHEYEEIRKIENMKDDILYSENGIIMNIYKGYHADFSSKYSNGMYSIELTRIGVAEQKIALLEQQLAQSTIINFENEIRLSTLEMINKENK